MLGYITPEKAKKFGFTHYGTRLGIPVYMTDSDEPTVCVKWTPMNIVLDLGEAIVQLSKPDSFEFIVKGEL